MRDTLTEGGVSRCVQAVFTRFDADKSGNIDASELGPLGTSHVIRCFAKTARTCMRLLGMNPTEKEAVEDYPAAFVGFAQLGVVAFW